MNRHALIDGQWAIIEAHIPKAKKTGRPSNDRRKMIDAMIYREKEGCTWRGLPEELGNASGVYTRYRLWSLDGTLERIFKALSSDMEATDEMQMDGTIVRAHQHSAGAKKGGLRLRSEVREGDEARRSMRL